uniref:LEM domain-containing protein n=1 Tax=Arion vulgaris TaxID=1028688 RepID=A0A0B7AEM7_9EUPU
MPPTGQAAIDVSSLSDPELSQILKDYGVDVGPVNAATRRTYERKLMKLKTGAEPAPRYQPVDDDDDDGQIEVTTKRISERKIVTAKTDVATSPRYPSVIENVDAKKESLVRPPEFSRRPAPILPEPPQLHMRKVRETEFTPRIESRPSLPLTRKTVSSYSTPTSKPYPTKLSQDKSKSYPLWLKLLVIAVVLILVYLIYANMEPQAKSNIPGIHGTGSIEV